MKRLELKRHNADYQCSYSLERAYLQGWNDADGSHWREPSEEPEDNAACLCLTDRGYIPGVYLKEYHYWEGFGLCWNKDDLKCWMAIPPTNVSKS